MKCPYCAEEIKDEAIVCRYCGRDLALLKLIGPVLERISSLEEQMSSLEGQVSRIAAHDDQQPGLQNNDHKPDTAQTVDQHAESPVAADKGRHRTWLAAFFALVTGYLFAFLGGFLLNSGYEYWGASIMAFAFPSALPWGFWAGLKWPGRHLRTYILAGSWGALSVIFAIFFAAGGELVLTPAGYWDDEIVWGVTYVVAVLVAIPITGLITYFADKRLARSDRRLPGNSIGEQISQISRHKAVRICIYIVAILFIWLIVSFLFSGLFAIFFVSGALFGDLYEKRQRWRLEGVPQPQADTIYAKTAAGFSSTENESSRQSRILLLQTLVPIIGSLIGLIGTIITVIGGVMTTTSLP